MNDTVILGLTPAMILGWTFVIAFFLGAGWVLVQELRLWAKREEATQRGYMDAMNWKPFDWEHHDEFWRDYRTGFRIGTQHRQRASSLLVPANDFTKPNAYEETR
jgi:hypothetical protein